MCGSLWLLVVVDGCRAWAVVRVGALPTVVGSPCVVGQRSGRAPRQPKLRLVLLYPSDAASDKNG